MLGSSHYWSVNRPPASLLYNTRTIQIYIMARRKKKITYSSKETRIVIGLGFLFAAIIFLIAVLDTPDTLANGEAGTPTFFSLAREFFGQTLIFASFVMFNLALYYFDIKYVFTKGLSLISQIGLLFLYPTFLSSLVNNEQLAKNLAAQGLSGGTLGYTLSWDIFFDRPFANFTPHIVGAACLILLLLAISVSLDQIGTFIKKVLLFIVETLQKAFSRRDAVANEVKDVAAAGSKGVLTAAKRFSDFDRREQSKKDEAKPQKKNETEKTEKPQKQQLSAEQELQKVQKDTKVDVKEKEIGEDGLVVTELAYPDWKLPPVSLMNPYKKQKMIEADAARNSEIIEQTLKSFNTDAKVVDVFVGPSVVQYALDIPLGVKVAKIAGLSPNIALALGIAVNQIRIEPIPGTTYLGIEVPRSKRDPVYIKEMVEDLKQQKKKYLGVSVGKDISGKGIVADIKKMPHLLIAGATGSGKSVLTNAFITSLLMQKTPDELKLILVDPKQVELTDYNGIPHLLTPVITDMAKVVNALKWCVNEMENRYTKLAEAKVRNIEGYNEKMGFAAIPYIVVVIDEMADMMLTADKNEAETAIVRLAQKARATGIHLILATQRPSVNVITGIIKANIPGRIGMSVTSSTDSRVILDQTGADSLLGYGDLLYKAPDKTKAERVQSPLVTQEEIGRVVDFIKSQSPEVAYATSILESQSEGGGEGGALADMSGDDLFTQAIKIVVNYQKGSSSFLQRRLNIGFNRAARILDEMEEAGVVGPPNGSKPREVLISDVDAFLESLKAKN